MPPGLHAEKQYYTGYEIRKKCASPMIRTYAFMLLDGCIIAQILRKMQARLRAKFRVFYRLPSCVNREKAPRI